MHDLLYDDDNVFMYYVMHILISYHIISSPPSFTSNYFEQQTIRIYIYILYNILIV